MRGYENLDYDDTEPLFTPDDIAEFERLAVEHRERVRRLGGRWGLLKMDVGHQVYNVWTDTERWRRRLRCRFWLARRRWKRHVKMPDAGN